MSSAKLARLLASVPARIQKAREIYAGQIGQWIRKYHGGCPAGFMAAIAEFESGGRMIEGDDRLGEVGFFQITGSFPPKVGVIPSARYKPEVNVFLGGLEYNMAAAELKVHHPWLDLASADIWKLARLSFAIGKSGTRQLIDGSRTDGHSPWRDVKRYVSQTGGVSLGRQSASKVWFRVHAVDVQWHVGSYVAPIVLRAPVAIPSPPGINYVVPPAVARYMPSPYRGPIIAAALVAAPFFLV